ncbi:TetR/AcrR family transcriptional regulator [Actinomadura madurae]|uniref:TetR/AcrR family transcriptional regulator n=1 Tax=Actinomadura madurae TaxID=1993 RepID=UPI0020275A7A|nr:TetR/AcrR family transcriptional regulator [Actinomadura madurae]MCP9949824.1 TetR/AcrR family transcriptional regulator [Actinomadura madurae]MCP9966573.1 TetR/AcrR family transcriptional regulator [Actinomadura madurae]MCP9979067.1 TetR/AcrR family transcriptional regulator [Actinomadura madurae]MCQ0009408.1 TetR/AcrR family transcriptional regulator [Actinomadura madurae]MCQ0015249.1 TetR/AcrR family transcriptional regulator [Actinomadura madurae]
MDKATGQGTRPSSVEQGAATRAAILTATAALIGELGWGQVTMRAIAARAGVPHGAISYHFQGKDDLLRQAAIAGTLQALAEPLAMAQAAGDVREMFEGTLGWFAGGGLEDPSVALLLETVRQSSRDPSLREPLATEMRRFRVALTELVRRDQEQGAVTAAPPASGTATVVAALLDGLLLHLILDPELDLQGAAEAVRTLLRGG